MLLAAFSSASVPCQCSLWSYTEAGSVLQVCHSVSEEKVLAPPHVPHRVTEVIMVSYQSKNITGSRKSKARRKLWYVMKTTK